MSIKTNIEVSKPVAPFGARPRFILLCKSVASEGGARSEGAFRDSEIKKGSSHWPMDNGIGPKARRFGDPYICSYLIKLIMSDKTK